MRAAWNPSSAKISSAADRIAWTVVSRIRSRSECRSDSLSERRFICWYIGSTARACQRCRAAKGWPASGRSGFIPRTRTVGGRAMPRTARLLLIALAPLLGIACADSSPFEGTTGTGGSSAGKNGRGGGGGETAAAGRGGTARHSGPAGGGGARRLGRLDRHGRDRRARGLERRGNRGQGRRDGGQRGRRRRARRKR